MARGELEGEEVSEITGLEGGRARFADLSLGDGRALELIEFTSEEVTPVDANFYDPGSGHLSLRVASAAETHAALVAAGAPVRSEPVELTEPGYWFGARCFYAADPDGVTVEIIERP